MSLIREYLSGVEYRCVDAADDLRLHFIASDEFFPDQVSVTVTVDFGSSHLWCAGDDGGTTALPIGLAHFMEHYLFWLHFHERLVPLERTYLSTPNAVVTYDRSLWGLRNAVVAEEVSFNPAFDEGRTVAGVCDIVRRFLSVLTEEYPVSESLVERTVNDIKNEIGERHSNLDYRLNLKLRETLYEINPVRHDILGIRESLKDIQASHVALAMRLIRANIRSVVILAHRLTDSLISAVEQTVADLLRGSPKTPLPLVSATEPVKVSRAANGMKGRYAFDWAFVLLGVKLLPLRQAFPAPDEFRRAYVLSHIMMHHAKERCGGLLSPDARAYFVGGRVEDSLFFWETGQMIKVIKDLKNNLLNKIKVFRDHLDLNVGYALSSTVDHPHRLMKMCHAADVYGLKLTDFMDTIPLLAAKDVDRLLDELIDTRGNLSLVYTEPDF